MNLKMNLVLSVLFASGLMGAAFGEGLTNTTCIHRSTPGHYGRPGGPSYSLKYESNGTFTFQESEGGPFNLKGSGRVGDSSGLYQKQFNLRPALASVQSMNPVDLIAFDGSSGEGYTSVPENVRVTAAFDIVSALHTVTWVGGVKSQIVFTIYLMTYGDDEFNEYNREISFDISECTQG